MCSRSAAYAVDLFNVRHCDLDEVLAGSLYVDYRNAVKATPMGITIVSVAKNLALAKNLATATEGPP